MKPRMQQARRAVLVRGLLATAAAWLLAAAVFTGWLAWRARVVSRPFDPVLWRSAAARLADDHGRTQRQAMVDDLLGQRLRAGMTVREVLELVGPPDIDPGDEGQQAMNDWVWRMGAERDPFVSGSEWLSVAWDGQGRVARAWLWNA